MGPKGRSRMFANDTGVKKEIRNVVNHTRGKLRMGKPKPHKTKNPQIRTAIITDIAQGKSQTETAKDTGVSVSTVSRLIQKPNIRALIEEQRERLSCGLPQAAANVLSFVNGMESAPDVRSK